MVTSTDLHIDLIRQICDSQPESVVLVTPVWSTSIHPKDQKIIDFEFVYCNPASLATSGLNNLLGKLVLADKVPDPGFSETIFSQCLQVYQTGKPLEYSYYSESLNKYLVLQRVKVFDGVMTTLRNKTEEYHGQIEKVQQAKLLQSMIDTAPYGISLYESIRNSDMQIVDFRLKLCNRKSAEITAFSMDELYSNTVKQLMAIRGHSNYFDICARVVETGQPHYTEYYSKMRKQWLGFSIVKFEDGYLLNYIDITETKEAQQQLEKTIVELKRSNASLEDFAHAASHDLKEPIRKIQFYAERIRTLNQSRLDEQGLKNFERLEVAAARMKLLIDDLLDYSHVNQGAGTIEEVNLQEKVDIVLEDLELSVKEKQAIVKRNGLPVVKANRRQMQQLFQNLISNALKYHKPGSPPVIFITGDTLTGKETGFKLSEEEQSKQFHLITVKDNGIGFDQKEADRIFNVFTRLHSASQFKGTGVGLSIVRKVVENHQGYIEATSSPGEGATFRILLPA